MKMDNVFLGLAVKQETPDDVIDAAPLRSSAMQWSFSNKSSAHPQLLSFHASQEDRPKTGFDSLASTGLVTITTTSAVDSDIQKSYSGMMQKNVVQEKQGGVRYTVTTYPTKNHDTRGIHHNSFVAGHGISSPQLSGVPMANPISNSPVVGTTDLRNSSKNSGVPSQLTIFYNGSVCVYDNISHEKAQAIMLLAGNGPPTNCSKPVPAVPAVQVVNRPPMTCTTAVPAVPVQAPMPMPTVLESFVVNQPYGTAPRLSSPPLIKKITVSQSASIIDSTASTQGGVLLSYSKAEPRKVVNSSGSDTVPQFRRKSLARFLEKRKERVIHASPYANKQSPGCTTPGGGSTNSSGSCPVLHVN